MRGERIAGEVPYTEGGPWPFPLAAGYQSCGIVESVGDEVTDVQPGQWVFGTVGHVEDMFMPIAGHIDPKSMDRSQVWPIPEGISTIAVSGLVLTQVGYNCGIRPTIRGGEAALVIGDGMVGQWAAQTLHWRGARVILAGRHEDRLALFSEDTRRIPLNVSKTDLVESVKNLAPEGIQVAVDTVGSVESLRRCIDLMKFNGHLVSAGFNGDDSMLDLQSLRLNELTLHSPSGWRPDRMQETMRLIAEGHLETEKLITHRFPAERAADAWDLILNRREGVLGVILEWN